MSTYTITGNTLTTKYGWRVTITTKGDHIHVKGSKKRFRQAALTNIKSDLTAFERKYVLVYLYKMLRMSEQFGKRHYPLKSINYAEVFGSCFE